MSTLYERTVEVSLLAEQRGIRAAHLQILDHLRDLVGYLTDPESAYVAERDMERAFAVLASGIHSFPDANADQHWEDVREWITDRLDLHRLLIHPEQKED